MIWRGKSYYVKSIKKNGWSSLNRRRRALYKIGERFGVMSLASLVRDNDFIKKTLSAEGKQSPFMKTDILPSERNGKSN
jgi:hypothetical protein